MDYTFTEEQEMFRGMFEDFVAKEVEPRAEHISEDEAVPMSLLKKGAMQGFLGALLPEDFGGAALDAVSYILLLEEIAKADMSTAMILHVHNSLVSRAILLCGSEAQKEQWLPALAEGSVIGAWAFAEPDSISLASMQAIAKADGDGYSLHGAKAWVSNAGIAGLYVIFADAPEGPTAFLAPADAEGIKLGSRDKTLGMRGVQIHPVYLNDAPVPRESVLGQPGGAQAVLDQVADFSRLAMAAIALGGSQHALDLGVKFAIERKQFGLEIARKGAIQAYIADSALEVETLRSQIYRCASLAEQGKLDREAAAIANDGVYMKPHLVKEVRNFRGETIRQFLPERLRRVCTSNTSRRMLELMEAVVREGTGKAAALPGYRVGGKTGTTIKLDPETRRYSRGNYIGSFCGVVPVDDPEVCIYIWIDNPRGGTYYGGQVAAPVFKEIAQTAVKVLSIPPSSGVPPPPSKVLEIAMQDLRDLPPGGFVETPPEDEPVAPGCMPDLRGLTIREVHERLAALDLPFEARGSGVVIDQIPKPFETIDSREPVQVIFGTEEQYRQVLLAQEWSHSGGPVSSQKPPQSSSMTETPVLKIVSRKHAVEIPLTGESSSTDGLVTAKGLPRPEVSRTVQHPEPTVAEDPDPRVRRGPAPDAGRNVWKKVVEDALKIPSDTPNTVNQGNTPDAISPTQGRSQGPVKSAYELQQTSSEQRPESDRER